MHRVARQALRLRRVTTRPCTSLRSTLSPARPLLRSYSTDTPPSSTTTSTHSPTGTGTGTGTPPTPAPAPAPALTPTQKIDKILASLHQHTTTDNLAQKISALLVLAASDKLQTARVVAAVRPLVHAPDIPRALLSKKVDMYCEDPPADAWDAFVARLDSDLHMLEEDTRYTNLPTDPSLEHPGFTLEKHLQDPSVQETLEQIHILRRADMLEPLRRLEQDASDMNAYIELARLFEDFGVPITYERRTVPLDLISEDAPETYDEVRALISANEQEIAAADPELAAEMAAEEAEFSQRAHAPPPLPPPPTPGVEAEPGSGSGSGAASPAAAAPRPAAGFAYPDLMTPDPLLDSRDVLELPPDGKQQIFHNRVIIRNHTSIFHEAMEAQGFDFSDPGYMPTRTDETEESASSLENLPLSPGALRELYRFPLVRRRVTQQTGKGKIHRLYVLMVVGDGNGMVGLGQGKDDDGTRAEAKAFAQAVRNMDWVERFEGRTIWTDMETKLGSTQLLLRPRPVGFGLRCNPNLHQVLKAAGIKDISAKVWGSRNPINVIKAAFRVLQAGHAPLGMGDGIGGKARKLNKGSGLRSKEDVERERGRQLISLRK